MAERAGAARARGARGEVRAVGAREAEGQRVEVVARDVARAASEPGPADPEPRAVLAVTQCRNAHGRAGAAAILVEVAIGDGAEAGARRRRGAALPGAEREDLEELEQVVVFRELPVVR